MEKLHFNLSDEESSKGWRILLGIFAAVFILSGIFILGNYYVLGRSNIPVSFSIVPFVIGILVAGIALYVSIRRKEQYFNINRDVIEFRYGVFKASNHSFKWSDIKEITLPRRQKKARIHMKDGSDFTINLTWLDRKKASMIRKCLIYLVNEKEINLIKVVRLRN
jgi:membrane protein YdbS with pleckstrin-like domain